MALSWRAVGERLRQARVLRGLTVPDAAAALGVSPTTLRKIEAGHARHVVAGTVSRYADLLALPVHLPATDE